MVDSALYETPDSALVLEAIGMLRSRLHNHGVAIYVSGIDGSGKTTLARTLVDMLAASGMRARHMHVYQWYWNVVLMPVLLLYNRHVGRRVLVLDRGIYDNIAVMAVKRRCPGWLWRTALGLVHALYPQFDYRFYLVAEFPETVLRRPETREARFVALGQVYDRVARRLHCMRLQSDQRLLGAALRGLTG